MASPTVINSTSQFSNICNSNTYVVVDFHATWCGPCKAIAPVFNQLAATETKPGRLAFAKVDVDAQPEIAQRYGVSAMPTFLILKSSTVTETIRGANPSALRAAVLSAAANAAKGSAKTSASFQSKGHVLGSDTVTAAGGNQRPFGAQFAGVASAGANFVRGGNGGFVDAVVRFFGLYFTSLFAFDGFQAAEQSAFRAR